LINVHDFVFHVMKLRMLFINGEDAKERLMQAMPTGVGKRLHHILLLPLGASNQYGFWQQGYPLFYIVAVNVT